MRTIRVRNASILATLNGREIDFEIRTTKDSAQGFALIIDGRTWLEADATPSGTLCDTSKPGIGDKDRNKQPLFKIRMIKSNGCLGKGELEIAEK